MVVNEVLDDVLDGPGEGEVGRGIVMVNLCDKV